MYGHHKDSTNVNLLLTEPSQVIEAVIGEDEQQRLAHVRKPSRGQVCFDLSRVLAEPATAEQRSSLAAVM